MTSTNEYVPEIVSPPGETLRELMQERGITHTLMMMRLDMRPEAFEKLLQGKAPLTDYIAEQLAEAGGKIGWPDAKFWKAREKNYRESLKRKE